MSYDSVAGEESAERIVRTALDHFGRLDAVISNAGIFHTTPFDSLSTADWRRMIDVHLHGTFYLAQPAFRVMKAQQYGRFVFISSSAGLFGQPNSAHYAAAKSGVFGLANVIAIEGEPHGILANCVLPFGYSRMVSETVGGGADAAVEPFLSAIDPELVSPIVVYLASRSSRFSHHSYSAVAGRYSRVFAGSQRDGCASQVPCLQLKTSSVISPRCPRRIRSSFPHPSLMRSSRYAVDGVFLISSGFVVRISMVL